MPPAVQFHVRPELRRPRLVLAFEGWNDAGDSATNAARYIANQIQAVPLASIDPEEYYDFTVRRPEVRIDEGQLRHIEWPANEFLFGSADPESELVVGIGIEPHLRWRSFCDDIVSIVTDLGIRRVALLGAFLADVLYSRPVGVSGVASTPDLQEELGISPTGYEGPTGILGVLGSRLREADCEVLSLWAGLPHYVNVSPNARGSLALIEGVREYLGLRLDLTPLQREAAECEQQVSEMIAEDPELADYVRALKRREFAQ